jgi:flagellar basal body-associated protein FliL
MAEDHTVIVETARGGSSAGWVVALVLIVALVVGIVLFTRMAGSETAKDNAVTSAAQDVGQAARDVGGAAKDAGGGAH